MKEGNKVQATISTEPSTTTLDCGDLTTRAINQAIRAAIAAGATRIQLLNPSARHNLGVALPEGIDLVIEGSAGYYVGGLNDGATITVHGSAGWGAGEDPLYNYVGHPIQGALTSFIEIQNDPKSEKLEFANTKEYWRSRFKATLWNAAYSTQWNLGPISEPTVEKYGTLQRDFWNRGNNKWLYTGMGQIDLVMTPVGGFGWLVGEDILDRFVTRRVEGATRNRFLINATRCGVDPIRVGTNLLHGKRPWYRASRDASEVYYANQLKKFERTNANGPATEIH